MPDELSGEDTINTVQSSASSQAAFDQPRRLWTLLLLAAFAGVFVISPLVFFGCLLAEGYGLAAAFDALIAQYQAERRSLLLVGLPGVVPFALLAVVLALYRRWRGTSGSGPLAVGGIAGITAILLWANLTFWPLFLPGKPNPGFPHGLEMVIAPLFFAPVAMLLGLACAWFWLRRR